MSERIELTSNVELKNKKELDTFQPFWRNLSKRFLSKFKQRTQQVGKVALVTKILFFMFNLKRKTDFEATVGKGHYNRRSEMRISNKNQIRQRYIIRLMYFLEEFNRSLMNRCSRKF